MNPENQQENGLNSEMEGRENKNAHQEQAVSFFIELIFLKIPDFSQGDSVQEIYSTELSEGSFLHQKTTASNK